MANKDKNPPYVAVAPFVGAWIEMLRSAVFFLASSGRSLRGSVD